MINERIDGKSLFWLHLISEGNLYLFWETHAQCDQYVKLQLQSRKRFDINVTCQN
jgi:hypothetical protein